MGSATTAPMSHRLKILHIISSRESGTACELDAFAERLAQNGFDTKTCILTSTQALRRPFDVAAYFAAARMIRQFRPDVVHTWDHAAHLYAASQYTATRIIAEKRSPQLPTRNPLIARLRQYLDRRTDRFIVPHKVCDCPKTLEIPPAAVPLPYSEPMPTEEFLAKYDVPSVETSGNYYPVFEPQYDPTRRNYTPRPANPTPFLIGITLPLCSEHRILDALWVCETLNHVHLNFHAFFIGDGKDREEFLRYRDRWKLFSRVHFLGNSKDAHRLLPNFDVLLHLSPASEYSGAILSAMYCGVPVIALETAESRAYILDGASGMLIPDGGDHRFYRRTAAKRLLYLLENEEFRRSMQRIARERVAGEFNFDTAFERRVGVYREGFERYPS